MPGRTMKAGRKRRRSTKKRGRTKRRRSTKKRGRTKRRRGGMAQLLNQAIVPFGLTYLATRKGRRGSRRRGSRRGGSRTKRGGDPEVVGGRKRRRRRGSTRRGSKRRRKRIR